jgi:hypothetical protein
VLVNYYYYCYYCNFCYFYYFIFNWSHSPRSWVMIFYLSRVEPGSLRYVYSLVACWIYITCAYSSCLFFCMVVLLYPGVVFRVHVCVEQYYQYYVQYIIFQHPVAFKVTHVVCSLLSSVQLCFSWFLWPFPHPVHRIGQCFPNATNHIFTKLYPLNGICHQFAKMLVCH